MYKKRSVGVNSEHDNATDSTQLEEQKTLGIKATGISKRLHSSDELPQELTLVMIATREIRYKSRVHRDGEKGRMLQKLVKSIEGVVDLAKREYLETFQPDVEMQNVDRRLEGCAGPGTDFKEYTQHLLGIVQRILEFFKVLEARSWITAMLFDRKDLRVIQKYHGELRKWRKDFNNEVERRVITDRTTERYRGGNVAGSPSNARSSHRPRDHSMEVSFTSAAISNSTINVGRDQTNTTTL
ncbi:hypothetical protein K435DRAFT_834390 [Dendrothele bispora CBS 962.96]|uniref:Uncharacterized protein n=1 Tax=Dendrothele bispora (strain CBS 962.96) TaxID=1314807 RepID=A0A4S8MST9_DENBC|nr:hypothetical protein K435DRAFT_834390 [Dendrothele bispora CBS 962.96]